MGRLYDLGPQIRDVVFNVAGLGLVSLIAADAHQGKEAPVAHGLIFLSAALLLMIGNISRFDTFKASATGIEAVVAKAEKATADLKKIMKGVVGAQMTSIAYEDRFYGMPEFKQKHLAENLIDALVETGFSRAEVERMARDIKHPIECVSFASAIINAAYSHVVDTSTFWATYGDENIPTPDDVLCFLEKHGAVTEFLRERVAEYRSFFYDDKITNPKMLAQSAQWKQMNSTPAS